MDFIASPNVSKNKPKLDRLCWACRLLLLVTQLQGWYLQQFEQRELRARRADLSNTWCLLDDLKNFAGLCATHEHARQPLERSAILVRDLGTLALCEQRGPPL